MSDANTAVPAGWYADPNEYGTQRWWDGAAWTAHTHRGIPGAAVAAAPRVADGTPTSTPWIWVIVALPLLALVTLFTFDPMRYVQLDAMNDPYSSYLFFLDPWYLATIALSFVIYGATVWCAYLDFAALARLGYTRRFHWAWAFLSSLLYVIGRSVMVRRESGRGFAPLWTAIGVTVATVVIAIVWSVWIMVVLVTSVTEMYGSTSIAT